MMTKQQAERLAAGDKDYRARKLRGQWMVWCDTSDHAVEFDMAATKCRWFLLCENEATEDMSHPVLGSVPCCARCADKVRRLS